MADIRVGLDDGIDQPPIFSCNFANISIADGVAEFVEFNNAAHRLCIAAADRGHQRFLVFHISLSGFQPSFENLARNVGAAGIIAGIVFELFAERLRERLVERIVQFCGIPAGGHNPQRLVAHIAKHGFIERRHAADHGHFVLQAIFDKLAKEAESVRAGGAKEDRIRALHLRDITSVIRCRQRCEDFLDNLATIVLERALETGAHFVSVGKVVGDGDDRLVLQFLGGIICQRVGALRRR